MSVDSVTRTTASSTPSAASSASPPVDQQTFLKLLMAQLQNQDPLQPTDSTQFVTQLSQFSLVEQAVNQTQQLGNLSTQLTGISNGDATNLVGKTVTVGSGAAVTFDGVTASSKTITLAGPAAKVTATITDGQGNVVRTIDVGPKGAGSLNVVWDGKDDHGQPEPKGPYNVAVQASAADGTSVAVSRYTTGVVVRVSYDKGYPDLFLDSGVDAPIANLVSVAAGKT